MISFLFIREGTTNATIISKSATRKDQETKSIPRKEGSRTSKQDRALGSDKDRSSHQESGSISSRPCESDER
jgi:hypothetical protein